jgi:hypothetical protein
VLIPADDTSGRAGTSALQCLYGERRRVEGHVPTRLAATTGGQAHAERSSPASRPCPAQRTVGGAGAFARLPQRVGVRLLHELRRALPPTIFFFVGFNFIVLTTNLITRFDRAPLLHPILFKTAVYWVAVFLARLAERFVHFSVVDGHRPGAFAAYLLSSFSWQRFTAISLWILVLFLLYVTASEFIQLFGPAEMRRLLFAYRPSQLQLNRRQRARELLRLSRLTDAHAVDQFRDPGSAAHQQLVAIVERLARAPKP